MKYISAQPRNIYFAWQVEVMLNNFIKNGINPNDIIVLIGVKEDDTDFDKKLWDAIIDNFTNVNFYMYSDTRTTPIQYISSIRPHILKKHFLQYPELEIESIFYHDCDIAFTKPVDFSHLENDDVWYLSNTISYIGYDYIKSKNYGVYEKMCEIVGIDNTIPKLMVDSSGGAQYIMKGLTHKFWEKVEIDCNNLFVEITKMNNNIIKENSSYHPIQIWCADMWAVLWNAWLFGFRTKIISELDFCWPHQHSDKWFSNNIYHNSGVIKTADNPKLHLFNKSDYTKTVPYNFVYYNTLRTDYCSYYYYNEILETSKNSCLIKIIWPELIR